MNDTYTTVDYHTAGEPFRIVTGGAPVPEGATVLERRAWFAAHADDVRARLCGEPRGHADMYGCHVVAPDDDGAELGAVFWHKDGYSTACGHGTIALATWAVESGRVPADPDGDTAVVIDVPSGRVTATVACDHGRVQHVTFRNVPAWVSATDEVVATSSGRLHLAVAYGGAFYASVPASSARLAVEAAALPQLVALSREVRAEMEGRVAVRHPSDDRLSGLYGVVWYDDLRRGTDPPVVHQRNVTVFADGEVDRSPCGSGTSARLAVLAAAGEIDEETVLWHDSVVGTRFEGWVAERTTSEHRPAVVTEVRGSAYLTGRHEFVVVAGDPLPSGFQLR